jgi:hypothetical protein
MVTKKTAAKKAATPATVEVALETSETVESLRTTVISAAGRNKAVREDLGNRLNVIRQQLDSVMVDLDKFIILEG